MNNTALSNELPLWIYYSTGTNVPTNTGYIVLSGRVDTGYRYISLLIREPHFHVETESHIENTTIGSLNYSKISNLVNLIVNQKFFDTKESYDARPPEWSDEYNRWYTIMVRIGEKTHSVHWSERDPSSPKVLHDIIQELRLIEPFNGTMLG